MHSFAPMPVRIASIAGAAALLAAITACSSSGASTDMSPPPAAPNASTKAGESFNAQDVAFTQAMISHREQAADIAELLPSRTQNQTLRAMASKAEAAQGPEIQTMNTWLTQWGASPAPGGDRSTQSATGSEMVTPQQISDLSNAQGAAFERMWLEMMVRNNEGAVTVAKQEIASGSNAQAKAMAQSIIDSQTMEINQMNQMLSTAASLNAAHGPDDDHRG